MSGETKEASVLDDSRKVRENVGRLEEILALAFNRQPVATESGGPASPAHANVLDEIQANLQVTIVMLQEQQAFAERQIVAKVGY